MISIVVSTNKDDISLNAFKDHLKKTIGLKDFEIIIYSNQNEFSLSYVYNRGLKESKYDTVVFCHDDINLSQNWGVKLIKDFTDNPNFGIIGKAGSCFMSETGIFWEKLNQTMVGQIYHRQEDNKKILTKYSPKFNDLIEVVTLDGLFISVNKNKIKKDFDESIEGFHFYDHSFCISNYIEGVKIGVTFSFDITHDSVGKPNDEFYRIKDSFLEKYGKHLPLDLKPNLFYDKIKRKNFKKMGKVGVIIPTKGNTDMLLDCVKSFYEHCDQNIFTIFIADTGSSEDELNIIRDFSRNYNNIKLIEYDYYNFAKINNDVVKNHVSDDHEFLLFCNNDIELKNDVLSSMLSIFNKNKNCGSVGARLHYPDNTIQHNGVIIYSDKVLNGNKFTDIYPSLTLTHEKINNYYNYNNGLTETFCNTGALLLIRKKLFQKLGGFNENYKTCFEDVELGINILLSGLKNYNDGHSVAYHKESYTRKKDENYLEKSKEDFQNSLLPFVVENEKIINKWLKIKHTYIHKGDKFIKI